jgi:ankyrin repeat protein
MGVFCHRRSKKIDMLNNFSPEEMGNLKQAIDCDDLERVKTLMLRNPSLHTAPLGYGENGPLTWVAECRGQTGAPPANRLAIAQWMIENGSDIHQGGDGPLMRAALNGRRVPMMELLVANGADVNAHWNGNFPIIFAACETMDATTLGWLLEHGADPNCRDHGYTMHDHPYLGTALDYLIAGYVRSTERFVACIELLLAAGGETRFDAPPVLALLRGRLDDLAERIVAEPDLVKKRFPHLDCGQTGGRSLLLKGATLLHIAAEYGDIAAAKILIEYGAEVDARATVDEMGVGGQTPLFHATTQFNDHGLAVAQLLLDHGADPFLVATLPGHYERPEEVVQCNSLEYAEQFPGAEFPGSNEKTVQLLRERAKRREHP